MRLNLSTFQSVSDPMPRRKPKRKHVIYQSIGPLPARIEGQYVGRLLVFTDASKQKHGGLAALMFDPEASEPLVETCSIPVMESNALELHALLFGLYQAERHFPARPLTVFSDNIDAVNRLLRAKELGIEQDEGLNAVFPDLNIDQALTMADFRWIKGHSSCRGNTLADFYAREAAC